MAPKASLYSGGYSSEAAEKLNRVPLPEKIKCEQCLRHFMHAKFSAKQLTEFRMRLLSNRNSTKLPRCRQCIGGPADELTCHRCELTKGLVAFTKVQRRNPDTARCKDCQQEVDDVEPNVEDALHEQQILETQTTIGSHSLINYDSLRGSLPAFNSRTGGSDLKSINPPAQNPNSDLLRFSSQSSIADENEDGVWTGQNLNGRKGAGSNGADPTRQRPSSLASSVISAAPTGTAWDQFTNANRAEQTYRPRIESGRTSVTGESAKQSGNWAKQGAVKPDRGALREAEKQREALRKVQEQERARFEEEESSGSDWEL